MKEWSPPWRGGIEQRITNAALSPRPEAFRFVKELRFCSERLGSQLFLSGPPPSWDFALESSFSPSTDPVILPQCHYSATEKRVQKLPQLQTEAHPAGQRVFVKGTEKTPPPAGSLSPEARPLSPRAEGCPTTMVCMGAGVF